MELRIIADSSACAVILGFSCQPSREGNAIVSGGVLNLFMEDFPHRPALVGGILGEECRAVLADFFAGLRQGNGGKTT